MEGRKKEQKSALPDKARAIFESREMRSTSKVVWHNRIEPGTIPLTMSAIPQEDLECQRIVEALRQFVRKSALSDKRISMMMGIAIESLRNWVSGSSIPREKSLQQIKEFLEKHGPSYLGEDYWPNQIRNLDPRPDSKCFAQPGRDLFDNKIGTWFAPWTNF
jgi:hypothetical protein